MKTGFLLIVFLVLIQFGGVLFCADDKDKLKEQLSGTVSVSGDIIHESEYAYSILVPQGYEYNPSDRDSYGGILSLVAIKDHGQDLKSVVTILVKKRSFLDFFNPRKDIEDIIADLKTKNSTYIFEPVLVEGNNRVRCNYRGQIKGYSMNGIILVLAGKKYTYQLGLISYDYQKAKGDFERIIRSFKADSPRRK